MKQDILATNIKTNILIHLFVDFPCPKCGQSSAISLDMIRTKAEVVCPACKTKMQTWVAGKNLQEFADSFDRLHAQLHKIGLQLMFFHNPVAMIWSQEQTR